MQALTNSTATGYKTQLNGRLNYQFTIAQNHDISALVAIVKSTGMIVHNQVHVMTDCNPHFMRLMQL